MGCSSLEAPEMLVVVATYLSRKALGALDHLLQDHQPAGTGSPTSKLVADLEWQMSTLFQISLKSPPLSPGHITMCLPPHFKKFHFNTGYGRKGGVLQQAGCGGSSSVRSRLKNNVVRKLVWFQCKMTQIWNNTDTLWRRVEGQSAGLADPCSWYYRTVIRLLHVLF